MKAETWIMCTFKHMVIEGFDALTPQMGKQALFLVVVHFLELSYPALVQNQ